MKKFQESDEGFFKKLDDNQLIMVALYYIMKQLNYKGDYMKELLIRSSEKRQHIPQYERCEHEFHKEIDGFTRCKKCGILNADEK